MLRPDTSHALALILLPVLAFVGTVTFMRLVQPWSTTSPDAHRIGLVRSYYLPVSPELEPYLVVLRVTQAAPFGDCSSGSDRL